MLKKAVAVSLIMLLLIAVGCTDTVKVNKNNSETDKITIGVFPIGDMLPLLVGIEEGFFKEAGVDLELITFQSAVEKESAFQAGNLDGIITDLIVSYLLHNAGTPVKIGSLITGVEVKEGPFGIVAAPGSNINTLQDLKGKRIGMSHNTIIEYVLDGLLDQAGLKEEDIEKVPVPQMPVRLEMLIQGQTDAAVFPEPLLTLAQAQGANLVADDTAGENLSHVVLLFQENFVANNKRTMENFYTAYAKSVDAINTNPDKYHEMFINETRVPLEIKDIYHVPVFPKPALPAREDLDKIQDWLNVKGLIDDYIEYEDIIADGLY